MGQESGTPKMKDGKDAVADYIVTNVYEKIDGRWLMVSHHVQPKPNNEKSAGPLPKTAFVLIHLQENRIPTGK